MGKAVVKTFFSFPDGDFSHGALTRMSLKVGARLFRADVLASLYDAFNVQCDRETFLGLFHCLPGRLKPTRIGITC